MPLIVIDITFVRLSTDGGNPCVHGLPVDGECQCEQDYTGRHCEKQKHCASFRRYRNGSCPSCVPGYYGDHCEEIHCVHGEPSRMETKCECEEPYSGTFCDELSTKRVYSYYNRRVCCFSEFLPQFWRLFEDCLNKIVFDRQLVHAA
ncbi:unnamed protein product [Nippostrongylus brasiliensis]|uniref:EGF-like domain-containing protein n=1 Tax=Nippostrongylus brasiliensis TaxID=27835 RepID=A0A0N4XSW7_NIPBR|nr:unnamed protein product [Nippostrongylus brasiliensis]